MGAGLIQLSAMGPQDFHLTANPQITFLKLYSNDILTFLKRLNVFFLESLYQV